MNTIKHYTPPNTLNQGLYNEVDTRIYQVNANAAIESGLKELANCPKDENSLTALFFHLLQLFGDRRGAIALVQNLENTHQFGRRRDANFDTSKDFYCKYIENEQEKTDLSSFFALQIQSMQLKKDFTKSQKKTSGLLLSLSNRSPRKSLSSPKRLA